MAKDCGHKVPCGCKDTPLTTPAPCGDGINCPEATPCSETFDADCIYYTGEGVVCGEETIITTNMTIAEAMAAVVAAFCGGPDLGINIECGEDVIAVAGVSLEQALINVADYFCDKIASIRVFSGTTYSFIETPDPEQPLCTDTEHTITYLNNISQTIGTTVFNTRTCEPVDVCATVVEPLDTDRLVACRPGEGGNVVVNIAYSEVLALINSKTSTQFSQTTDESVVNTATPTALIGAGIGVTNIAANLAFPGTTYKLQMKGEINVGTPVDLTLRIKLGGATIDTIGPVVMPNIGSPTVTRYFTLDHILVCRTSGGAGTVHVSSTATIPEMDEQSSSSVSPFNTTVSNNIFIEAEWTTADASNIIKSQTFTITKLK
jgi:hypothetical protein